jgi:adenylate cyclase
LFGTPTGTGDEEFLGIGLADALVTRLSNFKRLVVRPTSSVLPLTETTIDPFEAGRELNVDYVLDGSIRRAGDRIRVSVQLLSVEENRRAGRKF